MSWARREAFFCLAALSCAASALAQTFSGDFSNANGASYNGSANNRDNALAIAVDTVTGGGPFVYVTGQSYASNDDIVTIKYDGAGVKLASATFNSTVTDVGTGIGVDPAGNIWVVGYVNNGGSTTSWLVLKYDSNLALLSSATFNGAGNNTDTARDLAFDAAGNAFVVGYDSGPTNHDFVVRKLSPSLVLLSSASFDAGNSFDQAFDIALDSAGNVFMTGHHYSGSNPYDYLTVKLNSSLAFVSSAVYNGAANLSDRAFGIAVGADGSVFVTGEGRSAGPNVNIVTVKYSNGLAQQAVATLDASATAEWGEDLVLVGTNTVLVAGISEATNFNWNISQYDGALNFVSSHAYDSGGSDTAYGIATGTGSYYYVTGNAYVNPFGDYRTIRFTLGGSSGAGPQMPPAPSAFSGSAQGPGSILWSWNDNSGNESGFRLLTSTNGNISGDLAVNVTSWLQVGLATNTNYGAYRVQAFNSSGTADSATASRYTAAAMPTFFAASVYTTSATFSWSNNTNPGGTIYELQRSTGAGFTLFSSGTAIVATDATLSAASTYYYQVRAINGDMVPTAFTSSITVITYPLVGPPAAPTSFAGAAQSPTSILWSWTDNSGAENGYRVLTSTNGNLSGDLPANATTWLQSSLTANTTYGAYHVQAFNSSGTADSAAATRVTLAAVPGVPAGSSVYQTSATVSWAANGNPGGTTFELYRSTGFGYSLYLTTTSLSLFESALSAATTYYYQVRARNWESVATAFTATGTVITLPVPSPPAAPSAFAGAALSPTSIQWTWSDNSGNEDGYRVLTATGGNLSGDLAVNAVSWTQTGLSTNTSYGTYRVQAFNSSGTADSATNSRFTAADIPGTIAAAAVYVTSVSLTWTAGTNPGGTLYELYKDTGAGFAPLLSTTSLAAADLALAPASTCYYKVRALNGDLVATAFSSTLTVVTLPALGLPAAPSGFAGAAQGVSSILWSWLDNAGNEDGYRVLTATGGNLSGNLPAGTTSWLQTSLAPNTSYGAYRAQAFNSSGTADSGTNSRFTLAAVPGTPAASAVAYTSFTVTWTAGGNPGGTTYELQRSTGEGFALLLSTTALAKTETGLAAGATYHYQVRALNGDAVASAFTSSLTVVTLPPPPLPGTPGTPAATALGASSISWTWALASGADAYIAYRPSDLATLATPAAPPWVQTGLSPNTAYGLRVAGTNLAGTGPLSFSATAYTNAEAPSGVTASSATATSAVVSWGLNGNPAGTWAELERSTDGVSYAALSSGAVVSFVDASLIGCTTYYWRVRNRNGAGLYSVFAAAASAVTLNTTPAAPGSLTADPGAGGVVNLAWTPSPTEGITGYRLYWDAGTGTVSYAAPYASFTSSETAYATGVLTSSAAYKFALRARHRCGVEESVGALATSGATAAPAPVRAQVKEPDSGKKISGNRVTVLGELVSGNPDQTSHVRFQYKASASATWLDIPAATADHPNPDAAFPYFVHWDVTGLAPGSYDLRAVASDNSGTPDPTPSAVTVTVDPVSPDIAETLVAGKIKKDQTVNNAVASTVEAAGAAATDPAVKVTLPAGVLANSTVTVSVISNPTLTTAPPAGFDFAGSAIQVDLSNGQTQLGGVAQLTLTYPATVQFPQLLHVYWYNGAAGQWERMSGYSVNAASRTITCPTTHFSVFAVVVGAAFAADLSGVRVYPVPFKPNGGNADEGRTFSANDANSGIIFDRLPQGASIKIYTISGRLVAKMGNPTTAGTVRWDAKNEDGRDVVSGGYFAVISAPGFKSVVKKLVIIR